MNSIFPPHYREEHARAVEEAAAGRDRAAAEREPPAEQRDAVLLGEGEVGRGEEDALDKSLRATEEIQKLGGSEALDAPYREVVLWPMLRKRGGWLAALFELMPTTATFLAW